MVARRQATVASKITAKMVELDIEEGDHVKAGQIIAKLDDTNIRAALNQANAQLDYAKAGLAETQVNLTNARARLRTPEDPGAKALRQSGGRRQLRRPRWMPCGRSSPPSAAMSTWSRAP